MSCGPFVPAHPASFGDLALGWEHSPSSHLTQPPAAGGGATSCLYIFLWDLASPARIS